MKAIAYFRVSTNQQDFERQISDVELYCKKENIELVKSFQEKESGKIKERKELTEMMNFIQNSIDIDYVVISELSRLGRTSKVLETIETLNSKKIGLIALKETIKTLNPDKSVNHSSNLILSILSSINSYELETIKYRVKSGIKQSRINGKAGGSNNLPYGYKKDINKNLLIDESESEIIKTIFNLYLSGSGTKKIANYLNEQNIPTRTKKITDELIKNGVKKEDKYNFKNYWVDGTIYSIITNSLYIGQRKHQISKIDGFKRKFNYEYFEQPNLRIIEDDIFNQVQNKLKSNDNKVNQHKKKFNYLLNNKKIVCGECSQSYFPHKRTSGKDQVYKCLSRRYGNACGNYGIGIDKMEYFIQDIILRKYNNLLEQNLEDSNSKKEIELIEAEIEQLNKELKKEFKNESVVADYIGILSKEVILNKLKPIQARQQSIQQQIKLQEDKLNIVKKAYKNAVDINNLRSKYFNKEQLSSSIVNTIISKIILTPFEKASAEQKELLNKKIQDKDYWIESPNIRNQFKVKGDKFLLCSIISGVLKYDFVITQRSSIYFDFEHNCFYMIYHLFKKADNSEFWTNDETYVAEGGI